MSAREARANDEDLAIQDLRERFDALMLRHGAHAVAYAYTMVGDAQAAEDLVQDTFLSLYQNADRYDLDERDPRPLVFSVLTRRAMNYLRDREALHEELVDDTALMNAEAESSLRVSAMRNAASRFSEEQIKHERSALLASALAKLPAKQRMALHLRVHEGLSYRQIGAILGETTDHVGVLIYRSKELLRRILNPV